MSSKKPQHRKSQQSKQAAQPAVQPESKIWPKWDATKVTLITLGRGLLNLAQRLEDYEEIDKDRSWLREGVSPPRKRKRGGKYVLENVREIMNEINEAEQAAKSLPPNQTIRETKEALLLLWETMGQPDVPISWAVEDGKEEEAIRMGREELFKAWERCGGALERLGAKILVMSEDAGVFESQGEEEWGIPMQKKTIHANLGITLKQLNQALTAGAYKLRKIGPELWQMRLNDLPKDVRALFLPPKT